MQWCPMLLNLRNKQPSLRQRSKQSLPAPTGRRPRLGKSVSHWNNPPQPLTRSYARLQGKLIYYRTHLRFRLVTQFMSCIEKHQMFSFWICAICLQKSGQMTSIIFTPNDTQENTALYCSLCLVGLLAISVGNVKVDYLWCIDLPAWQLTSHNKSI